jgi:hypothetical protein
MTRAEILAMADVESQMEKWLFEVNKKRPEIYSAYDAALVCANRAAALRAIAEGMNDDDQV